MKLIGESVMTIWKRTAGLGLILLAGAVMGCSERADAQSSPAPDASAEGAPYVLTGTQVWTVPDPVSGRDYQVFVSLPASYETAPSAATRSSTSPTPTTPFRSSARSPGA